MKMGCKLYKIFFLSLFIMMGCYVKCYGEKENFCKNKISSLLRKLNFYSKKNLLEKDSEENVLFQRSFNNYLSSLSFDLDPTKTKKAIEELNQFIKKYPNSYKISEAHKLLSELENRLEKKDFYIAHTYFLMKKYNAALIYFQNFLMDFPKSNFKEKVLYQICIIKYKLANNKEKVLNFFEEYNKYIKSYPNSPNIKTLKIFYKKLLNQL
ncbi:hypothetical protein MADAR_402 [Blattabacterium sp. (Mastotermes darwiniensis) str. MADAR]|uniref:outer membrane protein assembly factor BamD n=1 Tax=Blattabacterium sp. (Mastotermes darwiniensis) TaxID=39768 RepID=UPI000231DE8A|nr:outer membrane protein assembly factor BamD [Blattabacterium sp. (Mastotermes darwiniensis)]AER40702.1 hypothetical protein MADAR_402 [Blattabacterium sp. (Mastotermes darwiniensis) str. MADAR]